MNNRYILCYLLCIVLFMSSCEKDDLCTPDQAVTPRLVIEFRDVLNPLESKAVDRLQLKEIGSTVFAPLNDDGAIVLTNVETISIPLRTDGGRTSYDFIRTIGADINRDNIDFTYNLEEEYVSRACGFRVVYNSLAATQNTETGTTQWIESVSVLQSSITNNTDVHVQILH